MILVFGQTGQVAQALARLAPEALFLARDVADLTQPDACASLIHQHTPTAVINAAAYTAVDKAETDLEVAQLVNGAAPGAMARACADLGCPFVHISTDYVFPGDGDQPWVPTDPVGPLGAYGRTKLAGEDAVRAAGGAFGILRTSWVFSADGGNFVKTMLRLSETRDALNVVADQVGGPTPASAIAACCLAMVEQLSEDPGLSGTYHFSGTPDVSWADFARAIFAVADRSVTVTDIPTSAYPTPAARPPNSRLDCTTTETAFGVPRPDWAAALATVIGDLKT